MTHSAHAAIGLAFAGSERPTKSPHPGPTIFEGYAYACHIAEVLDKLNVALVAPTDTYK